MGSKEGQAFDLSQEPKATREAYGPGSLGQGCLLARRLVENGVRFIEVRDKGYDWHNGLAHSIEEKTPTLDTAYSQLIRDLSDRGLLEETMVILTTEFGRSPTQGDGRNHHPAVFSIALAGGGIKGGFIYGASDARGGRVARDPVSVGELHATVGWGMGIRPEDKIVSPSGRPFHIGDQSKPITDVLA